MPISRSRDRTTVAVPRGLVENLEELLTDLDAFLRHRAHYPVIWAELLDYSQGPGKPDACYLIDAVGLHAQQLRTLIPSNSNRSATAGAHEARPNDPDRDGRARSIRR